MLQKSRRTAAPAAKDQDTDAQSDTDAEPDSDDAKTDTEREVNNSAKVRRVWVASYCLLNFL